MLLAPVLVPLIGGVFVFRQKTERRRRDWTLWLIGLTAAACAAVWLAPEQTLRLLTIQGPLQLALRSDGIARFFMLLALVLWAPVAVFAFPYLRHAGREGQFLGFYVMTLGILMGLAMAENFVTLYMFFEMMSLITVPLVLHDATAASRRAGFRYLGYSVFGAGMALAGFFLLCPFLRTQSFSAGGALDGAAAAGHEPFLLALWFLMTVGFGAKAGMVPMQSWLPAAHPVAPAPASAVLSGVITKGGVLAVLRVTYGLFGPELLRGSWAQGALVTLALLTVFVGSMLALREKLLKRRLAYSTVSQVSYVLFGLLLLTPAGTEAALVQMVFHALAKDALFLAAGAIILSTAATRVDQLRGIGRRMPVTLLCFTFASLSLIGIPPTGGFVAKWYLASAALESGSVPEAAAGVAVLILSALLTAGYLLPIVTAGFFPGGDYIGERREVRRTMLVPMLILALTPMALGLFPQLLTRWLAALAAQLF
jgi:multicomponent Na+:H+ antiporter subunit D